MESHGNRQKHLNPNPLQRMLLNRFHHKIIGLVQQTGATRLLDAGCGEGFVIERLQQNSSPPWGCGHSLMGGDLDAGALLWGRDNVNHNAPLTNFDICHLPFPDNSFPLLICLEVLEHLPDPMAGLDELVRVSSKYLLLSVPHEPLFRTANCLRGKHLLAFGNDPEHLHNFTGRGFRRIVGRAADVLWYGYTFPWQIILASKKAE